MWIFFKNGPKIENFVVFAGKLNGSRRRGRPRKPLSSDSEKEADDDEDEEEVEEEVEEENEDDEQQEEEAAEESEQDSDDDNRQSTRARKSTRRYDSDQSYKAASVSKRQQQRQYDEGAAASYSGRPRRSATKRNTNWTGDASEDDEPAPSSSQAVSSTRRNQVRQPNCITFKITLI